MKQLGTEERLLAAGRRVMAQAGAMSVRDIAAQAGVTPGAIYRHFPNKEALIERVVAEAFETLASGLWRALAKFPEGSVDRLAEVGRAYMAFAREHPAEYGLLFAARSSPLPVGASPMSGLLEIGEQCVRDCIASQALLPNDPKLVTLMLWSRLHGLVTLFQAFDFRQQFPGPRGVNPLDVAVEATRGLLLAGLQGHQNVGQ